MARNGSGTYSAPASSWNPPVNLALATAADWAALLADLTAAMTQSVSKDGQTTLTGNLNFGSNKATGLAVGTAATDAPTLAQVQNGGATYLTSVSGTNTITASAAPTLTAYAAGQKFCFLPAATNTGAVTININSAGAKAINYGGIALRGGELYINIPSVIVYDGSQFNLVAQSRPGTVLIPQAAISAPVATIDITGLTSSFLAYEILYDLIPDTDDSWLFLRVGTGGGPTWQATGYSYSARTQSPTTGTNGGSSIDSLTTAIPLSMPASSEGVGSAAGEHICGRILVFSVDGGSFVNVNGESSYQRSDGAAMLHAVAGAYNGTPVTGIRLAFSAGNVAGGWVTMQARRN